MTEYIPVPASLRKRFYEPVILLDALREVYRIDNGLSEPDLESGGGRSPQQIYFCFLNKLSQICDSHPRQPLAKTVSAIVVLDSGTIEYRLASNQRDARELNTTTEYLSSILHVLEGVTDDEVDNKTFMAPIFSGILQRVLAFNRPRVEGYLEALLTNDRLSFCINSSDAQGTRESQSAAASLRRLQPHAEAASKAPLTNDDEFARRVEALLQVINTDYAPCLEEYMKTKTRSGDTDSPWSEARHALGRLLSYYIAIKVLILARKLWPQLFVDFSVTSIPSSVPLEDPPAVRRNAKGIINRMGRNRAVLDAYQHHAQSLQEHGLDERIRRRVNPSRFRPIVHAEVNLLDSVLASRAQAAADGEDPLRFFNEASFGRYIGSSKPTCLLCRFYFAAHPAGVQCRETHGNLYISWRAPDILDATADEGGDLHAAQQEEAQRQRLEILERMVTEVRGETGRAIQERSYTRKKHDSRDTPSNPLWSTAAGSTAVRNSEAGDELASRRGRVDLELAARLGQVNLDGASSARGWSDDLVSRRGPVSLDLASMRGWGEESRETTPESPTKDAQVGVERGQGKDVVDEKKVSEKEVGEKKVDDKVVGGKLVDGKVVGKTKPNPGEDEQELDEDDEDGGGAKL